MSAVQKALTILSNPEAYEKDVRAEIGKLSEIPKIMGVVDRTLAEIEETYRRYKPRARRDILERVYSMTDRLVDEWAYHYGEIYPIDIRDDYTVKGDILPRLYLKQANFATEVLELFSDHSTLYRLFKTRPSFNCMVPTKKGTACTTGAYYLLWISDTQVSISCWQHIRKLPIIFGRRGEGNWYDMEIKLIAV